VVELDTSINGIVQTVLQGPSQRWRPC
jgi:hypothetical protein